MLYCGLRPGEVTGLTWDCVDFRRRELTVRQSRKVLPDGTMLIGETKAKSDRIQQIPDSPRACAYPPPDPPGGPEEPTRRRRRHGRTSTSCSPTGSAGRSTRRHLRREITSLCEDAGIEPISPNELRHSAASLLVNARGARSRRSPTSWATPTCGCWRRPPAQSQAGGGPNRGAGANAEVIALWAPPSGQVGGRDRGGNWGAALIPYMPPGGAQCQLFWRGLISAGAASAFRPSASPARSAPEAKSEREGRSEADDDRRDPKMVSFPGEPKRARARYHDQQEESVPPQQPPDDPSDQAVADGLDSPVVSLPHPKSPVETLSDYRGR